MKDRLNKAWSTVKRWWWAFAAAIVAIFVVWWRRPRKPGTSPSKLDEKRIKLLGQIHEIERREKELGIEAKEIDERIEDRAQRIAHMDAQELADEYNRLAARRRAIDDS